MKDLEEIPDNAKQHLTIHAVETIDEVLTIALENPPEGVEFVKLSPVKSNKTPRARKSTGRAPSTVN